MPLGTPGSREWVKAYSCGGYFVGFVPDPDTQLTQLEKEGSAKLVSRAGSGQNELDTWQYSLTVAGRPPSWGTWTYTVAVTAPSVAPEPSLPATGTATP